MQPVLYALNPVPIVMDLTQGYHTFAQAIYPSAILIADHYHIIVTQQKRFDQLTNNERTLLQLTFTSGI